MQYGFIKAAALSPAVHLADVGANLEEAKQAVLAAQAEGANVAVFPETYLTGYTCGDLFYSDLLLEAARDAVAELAAFSKGKYPVIVVGFPLRQDGKLYNCAAVIHDGNVLGVVPKTYLPNYGEFYEQRQFSSGAGLTADAVAEIGGKTVPFGSNLLFACREMDSFVLGVELCEDLWAPVNPATRLCLGGATVIANLSTSDELIGKDSYRKLLVGATSSRLICGYIYANSGHGESTQDMVFSGHSMIYENGTMLTEQAPW